MKNRNSEPTHLPGVPLYSVEDPYYDMIVWQICSDWNEIINISWTLENWRVSDIQESIRNRCKSLSKSWGRKTVLEFMHRNLCKFIKGWQDNKVFKLNDRPYVFKINTKGNGTPELVLWSQNKYHFLRAYLGDCIPQTGFFLSEITPGNQTIQGLTNMDIEKQIKQITIQRYISGKTLSEMTDEEKKDQNFLKKLRSVQEKYLLLKEFISYLDMKFDSSMDLWGLSDNIIWTSHASSITAINSPNVIYGDDGNIYLIDFGSWKWNKNTQAAFDLLMEDDVIEQWKKYSLDHLVL